MEVRRIVRLFIIGCSVLVIFSQEIRAQAPSPPAPQQQQPPQNQQQPAVSAAQSAPGAQQQQGQQPPQPQQQPTPQQQGQTAPAAGAAPQQQQQQQQPPPRPAGGQQTPPVPPPPPHAARERTGDLNNPPVVPTPPRQLQKQQPPPTIQQHEQTEAPQQRQQGGNAHNHGTQRPTVVQQAHQSSTRSTTPVPSLVVRPLNHTFYPRRKGYGLRKQADKHPNGNYYHERNRQHLDRKKPDGPYIPHPTFDTIGYRSMLKNILFRVSRLERIMFYDATRKGGLMSGIKPVDAAHQHGARGPASQWGSQQPPQNNRPGGNNTSSSGKAFEDPQDQQKLGETSGDRQQEGIRRPAQPAVQQNAQGPADTPNNLLHDLIRNVIGDMQARPSILPLPPHHQEHDHDTLL